MESKHFTYLALMLLTVAGPVAMSFESKITFIKRWKQLLPAIVFPGAIFILWDILFTQRGVWSFNHDYVTGLFIAGLPIEEWMFFIIIPYCSLFIYETLRLYLNLSTFEKTAGIILYALTGLFAALAIANNQLSYTFVTLSMNVVMLIVVLRTKLLKTRLALFLLTFLVGSLPMIIVNGILTSFPVVEYNPLHFSNIRLGTIPVEDFAYYFLLLQMNLVVYEFYKQRGKRVFRKQ